MKDSFKIDPKIENQGVKEIKRLLHKHSMLPLHLAQCINVQSIRTYEILNNKRRITADTDLRLCKFFELKEGHFLKLQTEYDLALTKANLSAKLAKIKTIRETAIKC